MAASDYNVIKSDNLQQKSITGRVVDENNLPLAGVNVVEKGTNNGAITSADGKFSLMVSSASRFFYFLLSGMKHRKLLLVLRRL